MLIDTLTKQNMPGLIIEHIFNGLHDEVIIAENLFELGTFIH